MIGCGDCWGRMGGLWELIRAERRGWRLPKPGSSRGCCGCLGFGTSLPVTGKNSTQIYAVRCEDGVVDGVAGG